VDRRRPLTALLSLGLIAATSGGSVPLRELRWIAPEARFDSVTRFNQPCFTRQSPFRIYGLVTFEDPLLLGGQAARAGISCASCHNGGRGNPAFVFPGVSGAAGTADVTSSLFSSHRGDGRFNPKPIPDLTADAPKISRGETGVLEAFIRGLIVEEFDGPEPPARVIDGLAAYVRSLDPDACQPSEPLTITVDLVRYGVAIAAAEYALKDGDPELAKVMIRAARSRLGTVAERFSSETSPAAIAALDEADTTLKALQNQLREGNDSTAVRTTLIEKRRTLDDWAKPIMRDAPASLYNTENLKAALTATRTP
jgi:hypothetical protein